MKESKIFKSLLAVFIVVVLGAPPNASADVRSGLKGVSVKVSYADLNLETKEGANAMYWRLKRASKQVCDVRGLKVEGSLRRIRESRQCYRETLSAAVEKIDNELVTLIHSI